MTRRKRKLLLIAGLGLVIFLGLTIGMVQYSATPEFCASCHIMEPYVASWRASRHSHVPCVDCHYEPGLLETMAGKFKASAQVVKYITGTEGTKPWAEISDASCMREGCHSRRLLEGRVEFGRVWFDHAPHLLELRREKKLKCTSCHSQIVQGAHVSVTLSTCFLCHFKQQAGEGSELGRCGLCHGPPTEPIRIGDFRFDHLSYINRGVACTTCHADIVRGTGEVPRHRCGSCHAKEEHLERYRDEVFMHLKHVTEHKVDCLECHTEITHASPQRSHQLHAQTASCEACHEGTHSPLSAMYAGTGAVGVPATPNPMFLTGVSCRSCHLPLEKTMLESDFSSSLHASRISCMQCHGVGFGRMPAEWKRTFDETMMQLRHFFSSVQELAAANASSRPLPPELSEQFERAESKLEFLSADKSHGCHNPWYVQKLFADLHGSLAKVWAFWSPDSETPEVVLHPRVPSANSCTTACHQLVQERQAEFGEFPFVHSKHVENPSLDCAQCHSSTTHGQTIVSPSLCATCHHGREKPSCGECHSRTTRLLSGKVPSGALEYEEDPMIDLDCTDCHVEPTEKLEPAALRQACVDCHEDESYGETLDEWKEELTGRLAAAKEKSLLLARQLREERRRGQDVQKRERELREVKLLIEYLEEAGMLHNLQASDEILSEIESRHTSILNNGE